MNSYLEISVEINPFVSEIVCDIINEKYNPEGIITATEEYKKTKLVKAEYNILKAYVSDITLTQDEVQNFFNEKKADLLSKDFTEEELGSFKVEVKKVVPEDWSKKWKEHWKPSKISDNFVICPSWENYEKKGNEKVIILDPANAFGTGEHSTTRLCVRAIEKYLKPGDFFADIGTGSGILAIAAAMSGARFSVGVDNDRTVIPTAKFNAKTNNIDNIDFFAGTSGDLADGEYDFVAANILHNVLAIIMHDLKRIMKPNAKIIMSGILDEKIDVVLESAKRNNMKILEITEDKEWRAILAQKID